MEGVMGKDLGASQATGLAGAEAPEPCGLGSSSGIPSAVINSLTLAQDMEPRAWAAVGRENDSSKHRAARLASLRHAQKALDILIPKKGHWVTVEADAAHFVSEGTSRILCDRLPRPVTLIIKLASAIEAATAGETRSGSTECKSAPEGIAQNEVSKP